MDELSITQIPTCSLLADATNARIHSDKQVTQLARSIATFGFQ